MEVRRAGSLAVCQFVKLAAVTGRLVAWVWDCSRTVEPIRKPMLCYKYDVALNSDIAVPQTTGEADGFRFFSVSGAPVTRVSCDVFCSRFCNFC